MKYFQTDISIQQQRLSLGHTKEKRELNLEYSLDLATMVSPSKITPIFILLN